MELQELVERIHRWKQRQAGDQGVDAGGAAPPPIPSASAAEDDLLEEDEVTTGEIEAAAEEDGDSAVDEDAGEILMEVEATTDEPDAMIEMAESESDEAGPPPLPADLGAGEEIEVDAAEVEDDTDSG